MQGGGRPADLVFEDLGASQFVIAVRCRTHQQQLASVVEQNQLAVCMDDTGMADAIRRPERFTGAEIQATKFAARRPPRLGLQVAQIESVDSAVDQDAGGDVIGHLPDGADVAHLQLRRLGAAPTVGFARGCKLNFEHIRAASERMRHRQVGLLEQRHGSAFVVAGGKTVLPEPLSGARFEQCQHVLQQQNHQPLPTDGDRLGAHIAGRFIPAGPHRRTVLRVQGYDAGAQSAHGEDHLALLDGRRGGMAEIGAATVEVQLDVP